MQPFNPGVGPNEPCPQAVHAVAPDDAWNLPLGQSPHDVVFV
jgi:hypothetical protein